jgi:hypothetical protein
MNDIKIKKTKTGDYLVFKNGKYIGETKVKADAYKFAKKQELKKIKKPTPKTNLIGFRPIKFKGFRF